MIRASHGSGELRRSTSEGARTNGTRVAMLAMVFWIRAVAFLIFAVVVAAVWRRLELPVTPDALAALAAPYRHAWYGLPLVIAAFVLLGLALFPVLVLIAATGIAFGPVLGPLYAMAGALASASAGFTIGRWLGRRRVERVTGERLARLMDRLRRHGVLAVFLVRKVPAPFTLVNIAVGASSVALRDFVLGTLLAMSAGVVALAGFGSQLSDLVRDPTPAIVARAALILVLPLSLALVIDRAVRGRRPA
jgi:phospholipase D1/2